MIDLKKLKQIWPKYPKKEVAKRLGISLSKLNYIARRLREAGKGLPSKREKYLI